MKKALAQEAVDLMVNLPWGSHCCNFYKAKPDLLAILVPYIRAGLLKNELCLWVVSKPLGVEDALRALRKGVPRFDSYLEKGQIKIHALADWYLKDGVFNSRRVLRRWTDQCNRASASGYEGLRLTGAFQPEKISWKSFADYEEKLDKALNNQRIKALCTYSLDLCRADEIIDVVKNHGYAVVKRGTWDLIENLQRRRAEEKALEKANAELEKEVQLRTKRWVDANQKLLSLIENRRNTEKNLRASRRQLRVLARHLQSVREGERTRIARQLHDEIGQELTSIKWALERSIREGSPAVRANLGQALAAANELIGRVRDLSLEIRPAMLDDLGLLAALLWHFERYTGQRKIAVRFNQSGLEEHRFPPEIETAAYRIVQEALTNAARHADTDKVEVVVEAAEKMLRVTIKDPGVGFGPRSVSARAACVLSGMRERAVSLGGKLTLDHSHGGGTLLTAELPLVKSLHLQV